MSRQYVTFSVLLVLVLLVPSVILAQPAEPQVAPMPEPPASSTLFVENAGQWPEDARFQVWGSPASMGTTWLADDAIWIVAAGGTVQVASSEALAGQPANLQPADLQPATLIALKLTFPGANPDVRIQPLNPLTTTVSYFQGNDAAQWHAVVPVYGSVRYAGLYPGVDLVLDQTDSFWRLEAEPDAVTDQVQIQVEGASVEAVAGGVLRLAVDDVPLSLALPQASFAYRASGVSRQGETMTVAAMPSVSAPRLEAPDDNPSDLIYSTYMGGSYSNYGYAIAVDEAGNAYTTGNTSSYNFPTTPGAFDPSRNSYSDAFVAKLNPAGSGLTYATFLGGYGDDIGGGIAVDGMGSAYVTGYTRSDDFPTTSGAFDTGFHGNEDAFVVKLNPAGSALDYGTFLGGANNEKSVGIAVDEANNAYIAGWTESADFPSTPGAFDPSYNSGTQEGDAFAVKLNAAGSSLAYATFLGGNRSDMAFAIAVDRAGSAYVTGFVYSVNFPTTFGAFDTSYNYSGDSFVLKLNPAGSGLDYGTFLGGGEMDYSNAIAVDAGGSAYVTGSTHSWDFPATSGAFDTSYNDDSYNDYYGDAFVAKVNPAGSALTYATYLGGTRYDRGYAISVSETGSAYVTGGSSSGNFPTTPNAFDASFNGGYWDGDAFVAKLNASGSELAYATFLGGGSHDSGQGIAIGEADRAYVAGSTGSSGFPTTPDAFDRGLSGSTDVFIAKLAMGGTPPTPTPTPTQTPTPTATPTHTPTPTTVPWPDLAASRKAAWPTSVAYQQSIFYDVYLKNTGGAPAQVALVDALPLPYVPDSAWGGLWWDPNTETLRWQGNLQIGEGRYFGYSLSGPSSCTAPGTVYTNTLTIDDGYHPPFVRSAQIVVAAGPTPVASCTPTALPTATPTATATDTPTSTPTSTATPTPMHGYLPLILHH